MGITGSVQRANQALNGTSAKEPWTVSGGIEEGPGEEKRVSTAPPHLGAAGDVGGRDQDQEFLTHNLSIYFNSCGVNFYTRIAAPRLSPMDAGRGSHQEPA